MSGMSSELSWFVFTGCGLAPLRSKRKTSYLAKSAFPNRSSTWGSPPLLFKLTRLCGMRRSPFGLDLFEQHSRNEFERTPQRQQERRGADSGSLGIQRSSALIRRRESTVNNQVPYAICH